MSKKPYFKSYRAVFFSLILASIGACQSTQPQLNIAAAISLRPVLLDIKRNYPEPVTLHFSFSASGTLRQQIIAGAPYQLLISAGKEDIHKLTAHGIKNTTTILAQNPLVIAYHKKNKAISNSCSPKRILQKKELKIAVGNPDWVPVGFYAKKALGNYWHPLKKQRQLTHSAYQNIVYLRSGAVAYAVVYKSDLTAYPELKQCWSFSQQPAVQIMALPIETATQPPLKESQDFLNYLRSPAVKKQFENHGFLASEGTFES